VQPSKSVPSDEHFVIRLDEQTALDCPIRRSRGSPARTNQSTRRVVAGLMVRWRRVDRPLLATTGVIPSLAGRALTTVKLASVSPVRRR
jgi:hypothetical protein